MVTKQSPLIVHAIHSLKMGGLENGVVNLINQTPPERFRYAIVCIDTYSDFRHRIRCDDVEVYAINSRPGRDPTAIWRMWKLFRYLQPAIVFGRNLSGLDALVPAAMAGVRCRIHGEHGRDSADADGTNCKYRMLRPLHRPPVTHYVAVSKSPKNYHQ